MRRVLRCFWPGFLIFSCVFLTSLHHYFEHRGKRRSLSTMTRPAGATFVSLHRWSWSWTPLFWAPWSRGCSKCLLLRAGPSHGLLFPACLWGLVLLWFFSPPLVVVNPAFFWSHCFHTIYMCVMDDVKERVPCPWHLLVLLG